MEEAQAAATAPANPTPKAQPVIIHKHNNAPMVGAIIFLALVIGAAAIYLGMQRRTELALNANPTPTAAPTIAPTQAVTPTPELEIKNWENFTSTKVKDLSFPAFSISYPFEWKQETKKDDISNTVTLTKDGNEIKIYQASMGGSQCIFTGELPDGPASDYRKSEYVDIKAGTATIRRVTTTVKSKTTYAFCSNGTNKDSYGSPTTFGGITYTLTNDDVVTLKEMDSILATLKATP
jgi:hypothetical protein